MTPSFPLLRSSLLGLSRRRGQFERKLDVGTGRPAAARGRGATDAHRARGTDDAVPDCADPAARRRGAGAMKHDAKGERGAALLSVLLLVAAMAVVADTALARPTPAAPLPAHQARSAARRCGKEC